VKHDTDICNYKYAREYNKKQAFALYVKLSTAPLSIEDLKRLDALR
jgi:hypothetical protein